eukprot:265866-Pyramimonas_sp.AAC.1
MRQTVRPWNGRMAAHSQNGALVCAFCTRLARNVTSCSNYTGGGRIRFQPGLSFGHVLDLVDAMI